ncbi:MAG: hypothetical protein IPI33_08835 [Dehalococcoidia bacterium]|nr:hypothetical protein [Dehalococcoidia bacterium]
MKKAPAGLLADEGDVGEADDLSLVFGNEDGVHRIVVGEPFTALVQGPWFGVPGGGAVEDFGAMDAVDGLEIGLVAGRTLSSSWATGAL